MRVTEIEALRRRGGVTVVRSLTPTLLVVAPPEGRPFAVLNACPHQGAELLSGFVSGTAAAPWIECPLHAWRFDLLTGDRLLRGEPSDDPLDRLHTYDCIVDEGGMIWVRPENAEGAGS